MPITTKESGQTLVKVRYRKGTCVDGVDYGPRHTDEPVFVRLPVARLHVDHLQRAVYVEGEEDDEPAGYSDLNKPELEALAEERELEVEGTGADGNVLKDDLIEALEAADAEA